MRIGLLTSMMIALPVASLLDGLMPGLLSDGSRMMLIVGGATIFLSGAMALWSQRVLLREWVRTTERPEVQAATEAFRSYRKAARGDDPEVTREIDTVGHDDPEVSS